jgi:hypothetical protein
VNTAGEETHEWGRISNNAHPHREENRIMLRKISFALVTAIALGSAALAPAPASAHGFGGFGGWHGGGFGHRGFGFGHGYGFGPGWCYWHPYAC